MRATLTCSLLCLGVALTQGCSPEENVTTVAPVPVTQDMGAEVDAVDMDSEYKEDPDELTSLAFDQDAVRLEVDQQRAIAFLVQTRSGKDATSQAALLWSSSDEDVVKISLDEARGVMTLTGAREGSTTITARTQGGLMATLDVEVTPKVPRDLEISPSRVELLERDTATLLARVYASEGDELPRPAVVWRSEDKQIATVNSSGLVTGHREGATLITAYLDDLSAEVFVTITPRASKSLAILTKEPALLVHDSMTMRAAVGDDRGGLLEGRAVSWAISDPSIATIKPTTGELTALRAGVTQIAATHQSFTEETTLTVENRPVATITLSQSVLAIPQGEVRALTARVRTDDGSDHPDQSVSWRSLSPAVAPIDQAGLITGASMGRADIEVTRDGVTARADVVVPSSFRQVVAGGAHSCALTTSDELYCFGQNASSVLGVSGVADRLVPTLAITSPVFVQLSSSADHQCGISDTSTLYCWGDNTRGQLGDGGGAGASASPRVIAQATRFIDVTAGGAHTCAIDDAHALYCWGSNDAGQLGSGDFVQANEPTLIAPSMRFARVFAGGAHTCALEHMTGALRCWGSNDAGQLGVDNGLMPITTPTKVDGDLSYVAASTGLAHTCAISTTNEAYCFGDNLGGQLGVDTQAESRVAHQLVGGDLAFVEVAAASAHTCALSSSGALYCWGQNNAGQLGDGTTTSSAAPVAVQGAIAFTQVDTGATHTCALSEEMIAYCWGEGAHGRLGQGRTQSSTWPFPLVIAPL